MPPRTTRKSYRPRVSDRTMVGTLQPPCLSVSDTEWRRHRRKMKPLGWKNKSTCRISRRVKSLRRQARKNPSFITWTGKSENIRPQEGCFFLTSPFIELIRIWLTFQRVSRKYLNLRDDVSDLFPRAAVDKHPTQSRVPIVLKSRAKEESYKALPFA